MCPIRRARPFRTSSITGPVRSPRRGFARSPSVFRASSGIRGRSLHRRAREERALGCVWRDQPCTPLAGDSAPLGRTRVSAAPLRGRLFGFTNRVEPADHPALSLYHGQSHDNGEGEFCFSPCLLESFSPLRQIVLIADQQHTGQIGNRVAKVADSSPGGPRLEKARLLVEQAPNADPRSRAECLIRFQVSGAPLHSRTQVRWCWIRSSSIQSKDSTSTRSASSVAVWKSAGASCTTANRRLTIPPPFYPPAISLRTGSTSRQEPFPLSTFRISGGR